MRNVPEIKVKVIDPRRSKSSKAVVERVNLNKRNATDAIGWCFDDALCDLLCDFHSCHLHMVCNSRIYEKKL